MSKSNYYTYTIYADIYLYYSFPKQITHSSNRKLLTILFQFAIELKNKSTVVSVFLADPLVGSIATQYLQNREEHDRIARLWTKRYATWLGYVFHVMSVSSPFAIFGKIWSFHLSNISFMN